MNYILTVHRQLDDVPQSVLVKLKGSRGQQFPAMRSWAAKINDFDITGQTATGNISENFSTMNSAINNLDIVSVTAKAVIIYKEDNPIDNDYPRSTVVSVAGATESSLVSDIKAQYTRVTGKEGWNNKLYVAALTITLSTF